MRFTFTGKNITLSDATKDKVSQKIGRLNRLFPKEVDVHVTVGVVKNDCTVEITIPLQKRILRGEATAEDMNVAVDAVVDILEKQMVKYKGQLHHRSGKDSRFKEELNFYAPDEQEFEDGGIVIERMKKFALKPMDAEEAVIEMDMLNHNFYVFRNGQTDEVNVVYRRKDGTYGLIEPEY